MRLAGSRTGPLDDQPLGVLQGSSAGAPGTVIVCPAMPTPAKPHHHGLIEVNDFSHLMVHNITGWPAAVVRCGTSADGLPIGVQVVARPWQDATALAVAGHLEKVFGGWQPPPV